MRDIHVLMRLIKKYENLEFFNSKVRTNMNFHMTQLRSANEQLDLALDLIESDISEWKENISTANSIQPDNIFQKMQIFIMQKYINFKYAKTVAEKVKLLQCKEQLNKILNKMMLLGCH